MIPEDQEFQTRSFSRYLKKVEAKERNGELSQTPLVFDEPMEHFACFRWNPINAVMYTVHDFESFIRRYKDVVIGTTDYKKTMRRRYELFLELSKGKYLIKGNHIYKLMASMPQYAKRRKTLFIEDLEVLYKMRLLHVYSEERFREYLEALRIVFSRRKQ